MRLARKILIFLGVIEPPPPPVIPIPFKYEGENTIIPEDLVCYGRENVSIGNNSVIGIRNILFASKKEIRIGRHVMFSPNVSIITGDHRIDMLGEYMRNITNEMKLESNDKPVVIEDDVWVGTGAIVLKGVTIGRGSVISAGAIVRKDVPPYTVFFSHDNSRPRFTPQQIEEHERLLREKYPEDFN